MKFYVNKINDSKLLKTLNHVTNAYDRIGLFAQCDTDAEGNFCGYYSVEYYLKTVLYATYYAEGLTVYRPENRIDDVQVLSEPMPLREVSISTHMWTKVIEAETVEEAIKKFENAEWRDWDSRIDEFGEEPISECPYCKVLPKIWFSVESGIVTCHIKCPECGKSMNVTGPNIEYVRKECISLWNKYADNEDTNLFDYLF